jgi:hypothetical protein
MNFGNYFFENWPFSNLRIWPFSDYLWPNLAILFLGLGNPGFNIIEALQIWKCFFSRD